MRRLDHLEGIIPFLFVLGCARAWLTILFADPVIESASVPFDPHDVFDYAYAIAGVAIALAARRLAPLHQSKWCVPTTLVVACVAGTCMLAAPHAGSAATALSAIGGLCGGLTYLLICLLNAEALVSLSLVRILLYQAAARFIAVPMVFLCQGMAYPQLVFVVYLLPAVAVLSTVISYVSVPEFEKKVRVWPRFHFPWKPIVLLSLYSFAYGLHESQLAIGAGSHSSLSTAIISAVLFLVVYLFADKLPLTVLFRSPLLLMVCGFLLLPAEAIFGKTVASYLIAMGNSLMGLFMGLILYDLSKRMGIAIIALLGVEKVSWLFRVWGDDCAELLGQSALPQQMQDLIITAVVVMLVLVGTLLLLSEKDMDSQWGIRLFDTGIVSEESRRSEFIAKRCSEIRDQCRLSPREDEILRLIASGKTNADIERELFIATGTLKAHIQHIYVKLGIHSRKDLMTLFEAGEEAG